MKIALIQFKLRLEAFLRMPGNSKKDFSKDCAIDNCGITAAGQQFYMHLENREGTQNNSGDESESRHSLGKTQQIKKNEKPAKRKEEGLSFQKKESLFSVPRISSQFGVFQNEVQKQMRLEKFWREEIDIYYKQNISQEDVSLLADILNQEVPTLRQVIETPNQVLDNGKFPFQELYRYIEVVRQLREAGQTLVLVQSGERHLLGAFQGGELIKMIEVSLEEAFLVTQRQAFLANLQQKQRQYNQTHPIKSYLSELAMEIAFLLYLMKHNKNRINQEITKIYNKILQQPQLIIQQESVEDRYVACLIRKNVRLALQNQEIDYLNYFANLDSYQLYGSVDPEQGRSISDKKQFEEYMKKKKCKKARKNPKGVLKTACGGCLSPHHQQYNPFSYCFECHVRFHKYCYKSTLEGLCEQCALKKGPLTKNRSVECQLCPNRGLLSMPSKSIREGVSIHIFCMLINGLWKFQQGNLEFKSSNFLTRDLHDELCSICNSTVYTYPCRVCQSRAHPLCAYLAGWNLFLDSSERVQLECCAAGLDKEKQSYRRKFMLNYKKILYKTQRQR